MSRYIDADALIRNIPSEEMIAKMAVASAPSIDIVRCGECRYWAGNDNGDIDDWEKCRWREDEATDADDFCSYGEREGVRE